MGDLVSKAGLLTGKMANARHADLSVSDSLKIRAWECMEFAG
jgi:hypothetical protein